MTGLNAPATLLQMPIILMCLAADSLIYNRYVWIRSSLQDNPIP